MYLHTCLHAYTHCSHMYMHKAHTSAHVFTHTQNHPFFPPTCTSLYCTQTIHQQGKLEGHPWEFWLWLLLSKGKMTRSFLTVLSAVGYPSEFYLQACSHLNRSPLPPYFGKPSFHSITNVEVFMDQGISKMTSWHCFSILRDGFYFGEGVAVSPLCTEATTLVSSPENEWFAFTGHDHWSCAS